LIGSRVGNRVQAAYSQEIDHNSEFGKVKHFADAPKITTEDFVVLELSPKLASLYRFTVDGKPNGNLALSRVNRSVNTLGPQSDWEKEFMSECLGGSNRSIELTRNGIPQLHSASFKRQTPQRK